MRTDGTRMTPTPSHRIERAADHGGGNPRRHRFVQEGEVPVEVMSLRDHNGRTSSSPSAMPRHRVDEAAVAAERLAREQAERAYAEISERLRETQTKLGHAELARNEAVALAADRLLQIEALLAQARTVPPAPMLDAAPPGQAGEIDRAAPAARRGEDAQAGQVVDQADAVCRVGSKDHPAFICALQHDMRRPAAA